MRFFFEKSISHSEAKDGKRKTEFSVIKGKNDEVHQIRGITLNKNPDIYNVEEKIKKLNRNTGKIYSKQKEYKLKSSNILNLLKSDTKHHLQDKMQHDKMQHDKMHHHLQDKIQHHLQDKIQHHLQDKMHHHLQDKMQHHLQDKMQHDKIHHHLQDKMQHHTDKKVILVKREKNKPLSVKKLENKIKKIHSSDKSVKKVKSSDK